MPGADDHCALSRRGTRCTLIILAMAVAVMSACGTSPNVPPPAFPGGTYVSARFHFRIAYPPGWQASTGPAPSATIPLTVEITRSGARQESGSLVSLLSISVLSLANASVAASVRALPTQTGMRKITLAGMTAFADAPIQQPVPGTSITNTHVDYFVVHGGYEYQLSTDSLSNDDSSSALASMLRSFTFLP